MQIPNTWIIISVLYGIAVAQIFHEVRRFIKTKSAKHFLKAHYNFEILYPKFSRTLSLCHSVEELIQQTEHFFNQELGIKTVHFLLPKDFFHKGLQSPHHFSDLSHTLTLTHNHAVLRTMLENKMWCEVDTDTKIKNRLSPSDDYVALPCFSQDVIQAILVLQQDIQLFSPEENTALLDVIGVEIALVLEKLKPMEWIKKEYLETKQYAEKVALSTSYMSLTRGIAHEIRNPMFSLLSRSEIIEKKPEDKDAVLKFAEVIKRNVLRILQITDEMLRYGTPLPKHKTPFNITACIENVLSLLQEKISKKNIEVSKQFSNVPEFSGDEIRVHQTFHHLILNSIQSLPESGGKINLDISQSYFKNKIGNRLNGIKIVIKDTGVGMSKETLNHIFEPFYSTKYEGKGLGLSIVLKTIDGHGGIVEIQSTEKKGTTVTLYLPTN